jgi:hypothetical protein
MHVFYILLAALAVLGSLVLTARWYISDYRSERREERAKVLPPYNRW